MLRESIKPQPSSENRADSTVSLAGISANGDGDGSPPPSGDQALLMAFVDAAHEGEATAIALAHRQLAAGLSPAAAVDAAAIYGNFERMNCIADAIGIELEARAAHATADLREAHGYNRMPGGDRLRG